MPNVDSAVDLEVLVRFSIRILIIFAVIFVLAILTPRIARIVDSWVKKYRQNHGKTETYGIRSIYELPPDPDEAPEEDADDRYYDLEDEEDADEEDYLLDEEPPEVPAYTEPVHLFSFNKLEAEPYELTRKTVRFGKKFAADFGETDLSAIAFGQKGRPAMYEPVPEPDDDEEDEYDAQPPLQYAPFEEHFFDDDAPAEPAPAAEDDDLPWFMR